jgi:hypothetical protein
LVELKIAWPAVSSTMNSTAAPSDWRTIRAQAEGRMDDFSTVEGLPIPKRLLALISSGLWPRTEEEAMRQNIRSLIPKERVQLFAPKENRIYLLSPPFRTVATRMTQNKFWTRFAALDEISPELSVEIAGFEIGSDSAVLLDYRPDRSNPAVIRLLWQKPKPNTWVPCARNFDEFADNAWARFFFRASTLVLSSR